MYEFTCVLAPSAATAEVRATAGRRPSAVGPWPGGVRVSGRLPSSAGVGERAATSRWCRALRLASSAAVESVVGSAARNSSSSAYRSCTRRVASRQGRQVTRSGSTEVMARGRRCRHPVVTVVGRAGERPRACVSVADPRPVHEGALDVHVWIPGLLALRHVSTMPLPGRRVESAGATCSTSGPTSTVSSTPAPSSPYTSRGRASYAAPTASSRTDRTL